ncbi:hypothetical protein EJD97_023795 [Solanum chilense]|uniref:Uncharacterized protein n=1 Tax=Solanum chilense TaxID=4083 RepID=A0A6N2AEZ0_SOLCI|nr:hypothetical protein EJD97_023795 [Solanum chilense]
MNDILNLLLRLACMSTFFMPRQICKAIVVRDVVRSFIGAIFVDSSLEKILNTFLNIRRLLVCASPSFGEINTT